MRILKLKVGYFKILRNFKIDFKDNISVFIGENGSGKSTVLECLLLVFRKAHLQFVERKFEERDGKIGHPALVEIDYEIKVEDFDAKSLIRKEERIIIQLNNKKDSEKFEISTLSENYSIEDLIKKYGYEKLLPSKIITYYAGWQETVKTYSEKHTDIYRNQLLNLSKNIEKASNPKLYINYIEQQYFDIIIACFVAYDSNDKIDKFFNEEFEIEINEKFSVQIKIQKGKLRGLNSNKFWDIEGEQLRFLKILRDYNINNMISDEPNQTEITFLFSKESWIKVKKKIGSEKAIFDNLIALKVIDVLAHSLVNYRKKKGTLSIHQRFLSEGEQQRITIMGIHEFMADENALILLDEPDVFLHPKWQRDFINELEKEKNSHIFLTTHLPQVITNFGKYNEDNNSFKSGDLKIMRNGKLLNHRNQFYGKDINSFINEYMGVEYRPKEVKQKMETLENLIDEDEFEEAKNLLNQLVELLGKNDNYILRISSLLEMYLED